tara:strand:- start:5964 stop:6611 length:648 start_codon:yes stop_codon:yes gene_type:complete
MKISVPTEINDITLEQYQRFALINTEDQEKEFFMFKTIEIFCGVDIKIVSKMRFSEVQAISDEILEILNTQIPFNTKFTMDGIEYGFIPDLQAMSLGEFIDLEQGLSNPKEFHKAAAVMYRPILKSFGDLYTINGYEASMEAHELMKQAPIGVISASIVFFYSIVNELLKDSQDYLKTQEETITTIAGSLNSPQNTGGLTLSMLFAEEWLQNIQK